MNRISAGVGLLLCVVSILTAAPGFAAPPGAATASVTASRSPIDQAGWEGSKKRVRLSNGVELAYVELGDPKGPPVLLLHGYTDSSRAWTIVAPHLLRNRLIIPDQRGHGSSAIPACCYSMTDFANDAVLLLDALGVDRAAVAGHSLGSIIAQQLAAHHPDRISAIALIGSTALAPVKRGDWMWTQIMALKAPVAANRAFLDEWLASPTPVDPRYLAFAEREITETPLAVWHAIPRERVEVPVGRLAPEVKAPVLILSGGKDALFPAEHHRALVAAFPTARAVILADLGHNLILERPHEVGPLLAGFLDEIAAVSSTGDGAAR